MIWRRRGEAYAIEGLVFVEVDVDMPQYLDEAEWVDGLAARDPRVLGAVACLPLERGAAIEPEMARLAGLKTVRGVRRLIQNQPDPDFALKPGFLEAIRLLPKYNLSFDVCILHHQLPNALKLVAQCPDVAFVLDHIAKPGIKAGLSEPWRGHIREMAALPNVVCKLSGVTTEADHETWTREQLRPYVDHVIDMFRPRPHSLRRRLAGLRACGRIYTMARNARLDHRELFSRPTSASCFARTPSRPIGSLADGPPRVRGGGDESDARAQGL
jgi:predicted TIM-barrel fold metal-dependent hydrolase